MTTVAFLMPCAGPVEPVVLQSAIALCIYSTAKGVPVTMVGMTERMLVHHARNKLACNFLDTSCEWAFWMDSDMLLEQRTIPTLLDWAKRLDALMVTGVAYQRAGEHLPCTFARIPGREYRSEYLSTAVAPIAGNGAYPIDSCGLSCCLMHRSIFEKLDYPYFKIIQLPGIPERGESGEAGEDIYFSTHVRRAGFQIYAVPELKIGHLGDRQIITAADMKCSTTN